MSPHRHSQGCGESAWEGKAPHPCHPPPRRMDPLADTLRRLREAFSAGRTRSPEFRAAQLKGLGRFLQENKQLLQEALAQDLHKVGGAGGQGLAVLPIHSYFTDPFVAWHV